VHHAAGPDEGSGVTLELAMKASMLSISSATLLNDIRLSDFLCGM
jgi:hypothetical protein